MSTVAVATKSSFGWVRDMVLTELGIVLDEGKDYLVESRLLPIVKREKLESIDALVGILRSNRSPVLKRAVLDAMTTNETTFLRDTTPFEVLQSTILPKLIEARRTRRRLRIWYAATSTGQEPYSVSMIINDQFPELLGWNLEQVGTDVSRQALDRARAGRYSQLEVNRGLPAKLLIKHFKRDGQDWVINDNIRKMLRCEEMNLNGPWPVISGQYDIVFIRNVLIYFDVAAKKRILGRIYDLLAPDGYMFLGAAETTLNLDERFVRAEGGRGGCYKRADQP